MDGDDFRVRMQHPIGITHHVSDDGGGVLYVADTYNHKIKRVLPKTRSAFTVAGAGKPGHVDAPLHPSPLLRTQRPQHCQRDDVHC